MWPLMFYLEALSTRAIGVTCMLYPLYSLSLSLSLLLFLSLFPSLSPPFPFSLPPSQPVFLNVYNILLWVLNLLPQPLQALLACPGFFNLFSFLNNSFPLLSRDPSPHPVTDTMWALILKIWSTQDIARKKHWHYTQIKPWSNWVLPNISDATNAMQVLALSYCEPVLLPVCVDSCIATCG